MARNIIIAQCCHFLLMGPADAPWFQCTLPVLFRIKWQFGKHANRGIYLFFCIPKWKETFFPALTPLSQIRHLFIFSLLIEAAANYVFLAYIFKLQTLLIHRPLPCVHVLCNTVFFHYSIIPLHSPPPWPASLVQLRNSYITVAVSRGLVSGCK